MKQASRLRQLSALGLFILAASFFVKHIVPSLPDFAYGLMKGAGIGLIGLSVIKQLQLKRN
jgi:hypothetical protein